MIDTVKTADIVVVNSSNRDWRGIYVNGELFVQGQFSHADMLLVHLYKEQLLISSFKEKTVNSEWLNKTDWLPQLLENCVFC